MHTYTVRHGIGDNYTASLFTPEQWLQLRLDGFTRLESLAITSARDAMNSAHIRPTGSDTVFLLSTTKGNAELLEDKQASIDRVLPVSSAQCIAQALGISTMPIVVCDACISGLAALLTAHRLLQRGDFTYAVVCGVDVQSAFTISGFQSLKALSSHPCRPFDIERSGLNLGEAAATMVLSRERPSGECWQTVSGAINNDAFHISAPSKTAEGATRSISEACRGTAKESLAFVCAHGTATLFNDQMESVALERAQLGNVPVNALKGYFGHTMGAAGILETAICMAAVTDDVVPGTRGFSELGVSGHIHVQRDTVPTHAHSFLKTLSGFGGGNAALLLTSEHTPADEVPVPHFSSKNRVIITPDHAEVDDHTLPTTEKGSSLLTALYHQYVVDYPRFHKMDLLSRLGFIATELLLQAEGHPRFQDDMDRAILFFGHSGSIQTDRRYQATIAAPDNCYPSPSLFVYTLPNIVTGEIAIRNHYHGETQFFLLPQYDEELLKHIATTAFADRRIHSVVTGWLDADDDEHFTANLTIIEKD